jgi:uncharacterized protein (TIGR04552 family)
VVAGYTDVVVTRPSTVIPRVARPVSLDDLQLDDIEAVRLLLKGSSVIDWHRLSFHDHDGVDRFLRVNEFDPRSEAEMERLEDIRSEAVDYLSRVFTMAIPDEVAEEIPARDLFLVASRKGEHQRWSCVVLKVMHIIHHLAGREALVQLPISDDAVFRAVELKVMQLVEELRAAGLPIAEFEWSRKPRDSQITKLLAKRSTLAAKIYDKLRFRLIVPAFEDLLPVVATLTRQLIPFNYVIPGESVNQLIDLDGVIERSPRLRTLSAQLQAIVDAESGKHRVPSQNEFSGPEYRIVNFVADMPLRIDHLLPPKSPLLQAGNSHVVFVLTEFQLADKATARQNDSGACSHEAYKARQHEKVRQRLLRDIEELPE